MCPRARTEFKSSLTVNIPPACLTLDLCELVLICLLFLSCNNNPRCAAVWEWACATCPHPHKGTDGKFIDVLIIFQPLVVRTRERKVCLCVCLLAKETFGFLKQLCHVIDVFKAFDLTPKWKKDEQWSALIIFSLKLLIFLLKVKYLDTGMWCVCVCTRPDVFPFVKYFSSSGGGWV